MPDGYLLTTRSVRLSLLLRSSLAGLRVTSMRGGRRRLRNVTADERTAPFRRSLRTHVRSIRRRLTIHAGVLRRTRARARTTRDTIRRRYGDPARLRAFGRTPRRPYPGASRRPDGLRAACRARCAWPAVGATLHAALADQPPPCCGARAHHVSGRCTRARRCAAAQCPPEIRVRLGTGNRVRSLRHRYAPQWAGRRLLGPH